MTRKIKKKKGKNQLNSDLVALCAGVQQALLDSKLQQVVVLIPHRLAAAWTEGGVVCRRLEHRRVHLTVEGMGRLTWEKTSYNITVSCFGNNFTCLHALYC